MAKTDVLFCDLKNAITSAIPGIYVAELQKARSGVKPCVLVEMTLPGPVRIESDDSQGTIADAGTGGYSVYLNNVTVDIYVIGDVTPVIKNVVFNLVPSNAAKLRKEAEKRLAGGIDRLTYCSFFNPES